MFFEVEILREDMEDTMLHEEILDANVVGESRKQGPTRLWIPVGGVLRHPPKARATSACRVTQCAHYLSFITFYVL